MKRVVLALLAMLSCASTGTLAQVSVESEGRAPSGPVSSPHPIESALQRAKSVKLDLRTLPRTKPKQKERPEREGPEPNPVELPGGPQPSAPVAGPVPRAPAPPPLAVYEGLDRFNWGSGSPPDTNGDVGPTHYIQSVNASVGIFRKSDGFLEAAFTFDTLMSQGAFGNLCDTDNFGDPVVLYDTFEDRWVLTDFAFVLDGGGNVQGEAFQCFAVSMSGDPLTGGWNFYSRRLTDALNDYPKFGIWPDGLYMSANMFGFPAGSSFQTARVWAFNKAQMYAGNPTVQVVSFNVPGGDFTVIPSNARLQTGTPPAGTPNYFISTWQFLNALTVYKFHVDWNALSLSTFTGPDAPLAATSWPNAAVGNAPQPGTATLLDVLQIRAMMQNQYSNIGGAESLWVPHTVRRANTTGFAAPRWYQVTVTGGTVAPSIPQAATWDPDAANTFHRFMPSLALDRAGNMAIGYTRSNSTTEFPSMKYAGRLASDPVNTFSKTEQTMFTGTASQTGTSRWGDYSSMTLDPDGCTFWYTAEYANPADQTFNHRWLTKFGSFKYDECTPVGAGGTISGTVTLTPGGTPISGATVKLGSRTATTNGSGFYSFTPLPAGTYPGMNASFPGCTSASASNIVVADAATTTQDFALADAPDSACLTDTTQADFLGGVATNLELNTSPGDITLSDAPVSDQANTAGTTTGTGFGTPAWTGQTFTAAVTGTLAKADIQLFCSGCGAAPPNLTLSVRNTAAGLPTGADLGSVTIPGSLFSSGGTVLHTATFPVPPALASGTQYALILRPVSAPAGSGYFWIRSSPSTYGSGSRVLSADSGGTWTADTTRDYNFRTYMSTGFAASGDLVASTKDANPPAGKTPVWTTLSWSGSTPANTTLQFQIAASNSASGPFNFVGPDNTAGTFFTTSGASLSQFYDKRYLKYRAFLASSNNTVTPTLNDATVCFANQSPPDLGLTKGDGGASVAPGGTVSYTLGYTNSGEQAATGVVLTETVPANSTFNAGASTAGWSCTPDNNAGSTCTLAIGTVAGGGGNGTATFAVTLPNPLAAGVAQISNTASVADDGTHGADATPANNSANDTTPVTAAPDLTLGKSDGGASVAPGAVVAYTLTYANAGNQDATGVTLTDKVPANSVFNAGASTAGWVCAPNNNAGSTCTFSVGSVAGGGAGSSVVYAATVNVSLPAGVVQIFNQASVADDAGNGADPTPANNTASDTTPITGADLSISKNDGVNSAPTGGTVVYAITASNAGPDAVVDATVTDSFPSSLTCTWTCSGAAGGTCNASGSGAISDNSVDLPVGASVTYSASCTIAALASGIVVNTATVATPAGVADPTPGNNSATDIDNLVTSANLSVTMSDSRNFVQVGDSLNYVIEVSNAGPSTAQASVADTLPALLTGGSWVCSGTAGVACAGGSGNVLGDTATVPAGGKATYVYSATVLSAGTNDLLDNTASASVSGGTDPVAANNSATDHDIVVIYKDGFEGAPLTIASAIGDGADFVTAQLRIDAGLADSLGIVPVAVARGRATDGSLLFTLELARFGSDIAVRSVTTDALGLSQRSPWQMLDTSQRVLRFDWQSAGTAAADGYLRVEGGRAPLLVGGRAEKNHLTHLYVTVERQVPWLLLITR